MTYKPWIVAHIYIKGRKYYLYGKMHGNVMPKANFWRKSERGAVAITVRAEPEPMSAATDHAARSALSPVHVGLASRAKSLERTNRLLFGLAVISFAVAVALVVYIVGQGERQRRETEVKISEAIRSVRAEFERKPPVVIPPPAELPPMPTAPTTQPAAK